MRLPVAWIAVTAFLLPICPVRAQSSSAAERPLKKFLQHYVKDPGLEDQKTIRYSDAFVDLNGDGKKEAIVYLLGRAWCGSGGCNTLILARDGASWKVVGHITITRPPIRVLSSTSISVVPHAPVTISCKRRTIKEESSMMMEYSYTVLFEPAEEGGFVVTCPALPGLVTEGDTLEEARAMAEDAIRGYIESLRKDHLPIPSDKAPVKEEIRVLLSETA